MRILRPREVLAFVQARTTSKWWNLDLDPGCQAPESILLTKPLGFIPQVMGSRALVERGVTW